MAGKSLFCDEDVKLRGIFARERSDSLTYEQLDRTKRIHFFFIFFSLGIRVRNKIGRTFVFIIRGVH